MYLFEGTRITNVEVGEFLQFLDAERAHLDLEVCDTSGEDALQHASRASSRDTIRWLLRVGSSMTRFGKVPWRHEGNPMQLALISGNLSAFEALLPYYPTLDEEDCYNLTMLDYAARLGHSEILRCLLRLGAEEVLPDFEFVGSEKSADTDVGKSTVGDAVVWTEESYVRYFEVLEDMGRIEIKDAESKDGEGRDIFWDANPYPH